MCLMPTWPTYQNVVWKKKKQTNQIYVLVVFVELHKFMEITEVQIYNCPMV